MDAEGGWICLGEGISVAERMVFEANLQKICNYSISQYETRNQTCSFKARSSVSSDSLGYDKTNALTSMLFRDGTSGGTFGSLTEVWGQSAQGEQL